MTSTIREVVYSIRHHGCPVSDASAAVPGVHMSTVSKIEKRDRRLKSLLLLDGLDADVKEFVDCLENHELTTRVRPFTTTRGCGKNYIVLTVGYDESVPSIASVFSRHDCFQPSAITVKQGFENWPIYHENSVDIASVTDHLDDQDLTFEVRRNVAADSLPGSRVDVSGNETQGLTDRQFEVLTTARWMGYYDPNRSITMEDIAAEMDLSSATICEHLNRAENYVISNVVDAGYPEQTMATDRSLRTVPDGSP